MAYDVELADRVRSVLAGSGRVEEKRMFGGLAFLVDGHMPVCVTGPSGQGDGLLVRVRETDGPLLVAASDDVAFMRMGERTATTWLHVAAAGLGDDAALADWIDRGLAVVRDLPPK